GTGPEPRQSLRQEKLGAFAGRNGRPWRPDRHRPHPRRFMHNTNKAAALRVLLMVAAAAILGACAQSSVQDDSLASAAPSATPTASTTDPAPATPAAPAATSPAAPRVAPAGRNTSAPYAPPPAPATTPRLSIEAARGECWMKLESDRKAPRDLDRRVALVEKCAADKMAQAAKEADPKPQ